MDENVYPVESPVSLSHPRLPEFCNRLRTSGNPFAVPLADPLMPVDNCYWNVEALVEEAGGELLAGWMLKEWPGLYLTAIHHAVWKRPDGAIVDVTQRRPDVSGTTTFVMDSISSLDVSAPPNVLTEYLPLSGDCRVGQLIDLALELNRATQVLNCFVAFDLGQATQRQRAIAREECLSQIKMTEQQLQRYLELEQRAVEIRRQVSTVIESLKTRPPNRVSRSALRKLDVRNEHTG